MCIKKVEPKRNKIKIDGEMLKLKIAFIIEVNERHFVESKNPLVNFALWYLGKPIRKNDAIVQSIKKLLKEVSYGE